jgi:predicted RecB family endonuclease
MSEDIIKSVQDLIDSGKGDPKRLTEILETLKQQTPLYMSDYRYLESLTSKKDETQNKTDLKNEIKEIKQAAKTLKQKAKSDTRIDDSLSILRMRLASGEITLDEYKSIKKTLKYG